MSSKKEERMRRLADLRMKRNAMRKANQKVVEEEVRLGGRARPAAHKAAQTKREEAAARAAAEAEGRDYDHEKAMATTAYDAERDVERKKPRKAAEGWHVYSAEVQGRAYEKRVACMLKLKGSGKESKEYEAAKQRVIEEAEGDASAFYREADHLSYGEAPKPTKQALDRLTTELKQVEQRRAKFSRRRMFREDSDVDYISKANNTFNKKVERAYGAYTAEIKANLERGTAL